MALLWVLLYLVLAVWSIWMLKKRRQVQLPPPTKVKAHREKNRRRHHTCKHYSKRRVTWSSSTASLDSVTAVWGSASSSSGEEDGEHPSQAPVPPAGRRIRFLPAKSQELLEGHVRKKLLAGPRQLLPCYHGRSTGRSLLLDQLPPPTKVKAHRKKNRRHHTCRYHSKRRVTWSSSSSSSSSMHSITAVWGSASSSGEPPVPPTARRICFLSAKSQDLLEGHVRGKLVAGPPSRQRPACHHGRSTGRSLLLDQPFQDHPHRHVQLGSSAFSRPRWETFPRAPPPLVGRRISFLSFKEQELLEWNIWRKRHKDDDARRILHAASAQQRNRPPFNPPKTTAWHRQPTGPSVASPSAWAQSLRPPILNLGPDQERPRHRRQTLEWSVQATRRAWVRRPEPCQKSPEPHRKIPEPCRPCPGPHLASAVPRMPNPGPCLPSPEPCLPRPGPCLPIPRPCLPIPEPRLPIPRPCLPIPRPCLPIPEPSLISSRAGLSSSRPCLPIPEPRLPSPGSCACPPVPSAAEALSSLLLLLPPKGRPKSQAGLRKGQVAEMELKEQQTLRVSWAGTAGAELPKESTGMPEPESLVALVPFKVPAATCQSPPTELLVSESEHVEVSEESLRLVLPPSLKAPSPAHLVVETLEEERATRRLRLRRAKCPSCPAPAPARDRPSLPHQVHRGKGRSRPRGPRKGRTGRAGPQATSRSTWFSWTDCTEPETLGTARRSPKPSPAGRPPLREPASTGRHRPESPCLFDVHLESPDFVEPPPTILQSLDKERAMQDLQRCLAEGLEKGGGLLSVEYPVCLLCRQCNPLCRHPRAPHGPSLLVYPRMTMRDGQVRMTLGFLLKTKGTEGKGSGLGPRRGAPQVPPGKEQPPTLQREDGWRSRAPQKDTTKRQSHGPERRPGLARGHPVKKQPKAGPAGGPRQAKAPRKLLCCLKRLVLSFKRIWGKLKEKMKPPPQQQDSGASPENLGSPYEMEGSSSVTPQEEDQGESLWAPWGGGEPSLQRINLSWDWKQTYKETCIPLNRPSCPTEMNAFL